MADYTEKLINDLPDQYKGKPRIEALMKAVGRQLDELKQFFDDLNEKRTIDTAEGAQLDMIGEILGLTRSEAGELVSDNEAVDDDEVYRYILKYKIMQNTSTCTYYDVVNGLQELFELTSLYYSEDISEPATITVLLSDIDMAKLEDAVWSVLMVKPAGVAIVFETIKAAYAEILTGAAMDSVTYSPPVICGLEYVSLGSDTRTATVTGSIGIAEHRITYGVAIHDNLS